MSEITHRYFGESEFQILTEITANDISTVLITVKLLDPSCNCCYSKTIENKHLTACWWDLRDTNNEMAAIATELIRGSDIDSLIEVCKTNLNRDDERKYEKALQNCINFFIKNQIVTE